MFFFCKQKTAYELRISDWSSDVCSSDLAKVQPATLVRLAQSLGFDGWASMKEVFVQSFRQTPKIYSNQAKKMVRSKSRAGMVGKTEIGRASCRERVCQYV